MPSEVFRDNEDCFDAEAQAYIHNKDNPLDFPNLRFTRTSDESREVNRDPTPKIIIASSGMCDAGRIRHHLKHNLWRPESTVIFVGYQAPGTLGRQLVDGESEVRLFGEDITVSARVAFIEGYSGHADQEGLLNWVNAMENKPSRIVLVHGEPEAMEAFSTILGERFNLSVQTPAFGESVVYGADVPARAAIRLAAAGNVVSGAGVTRDRPETGDLLPGLASLREDFMGVLQHFHESLRRADSRWERDKTLARARQWEQDVRRTLERYRR